MGRPESVLLENGVPGQSHEDQKQNLADAYGAGVEAVQAQHSGVPVGVRKDDGAVQHGVHLGLMLSRVWASAWTNESAAWWAQRFPA
jgi:hypothetical protein